MQWKEVRQAYPDKRVVLEAIEAYSASKTIFPQDTLEEIGKLAHTFNKYRPVKSISS